METTTAPTTANQGATSAAGFSAPQAPAPGQVPLQSAGHKYTSGCGCAQCAKQRQKWKDKRAKAKAQPNGQGGQNLPFPIQGLASQPGAQVVTPAPVPWSAEPIKPLVHELLVVSEKADLRKLKRLAAKISPEAAAKVEAEGGWNETAKTGVVSGVSHLSAKILNHYGMSSEDAPIAAGVIGLLSLVVGRILLASELSTLADQAQAERKRQAEQARSVTAPGVSAPGRSLFGAVEPKETI